MLQPLQFGKYLLLERIAVGGMAEVFVAKAFGVEGFERLIAIKKILPTMGEDSEFNTMFVDEARIAVQLAHANIVQVLELGKVDDNLFIAMEYISGRDVRQLLERFRKRNKPMPIPQACTIVAKVCEALDYAHRKRDARGVALGIVHRDVSPQNVLVSFEGDVKLIDFGIAKAESRLQRTQAGILKGKFSYMSPEQVRGQAIDHRSDVFAVGVLLWELLCGEKLFTGDSDFAVLEKVRTGQIPLPRKVNPDIPEALERVTMKALAVEVRDRYQWASELHDALVRFTLIGDMVYGSRQLAEWMREEFSAEFDKEQKRLRGWLGITDAEVEVTPSDPMRRKPLPHAAVERSQPSQPAAQSQSRGSRPSGPSRPPAPPPEPEIAPPLVQPPTPTGVRHRVPPSKTATPPPGELSPVAKPQPTKPPPLPKSPPPVAKAASALPKSAPPPAKPPPPPVEDLAQELPTMKMDGNVLAAAEKALAEHRAKADAPRAFGDDDDESTVHEPGLTTPVSAVPDTDKQQLVGSMAVTDEVKLSHNFAVTQEARLSDLGFFVSDPSFQTGAKPPAENVPLAPSAPPRPVTLRDRPAPPRLPASLDPALLAGERLQALPFQTEPDAPPPSGPISVPSLIPASPATPLTPDAFDISEERTGARRALRKQAFSRPTRDRSAGAATRRNLLFAAGAVLVALVGAWALWPSEVAATGRLVLTLTPSVPAALIVDGEPAGAIPPFVRSLERGTHHIEIRASGYKPFTATIKIGSPSRPTELQVPLASDAPMEVEGVVLNQPADQQAPHEQAPREPSRPRWGSKKPDEARPGEAPDREAAPAAVGASAELQAPGANDRLNTNDVPAKPPARVASPAPRAPARAPVARAAAVPAPSVDDASKLRVATEPPGADVIIDGQSMGQSPLAVPGLDTANVHIVTISLPGYRSERRVAKADDGRFAPLSLSLQPTPPASTAEPATPAPASSGASTGGAVTPAAVADTETTSGPIGYLVTMTKPVAKVFIDGKDTGRWTPVVPKYPISLAPGPHTVTFETTEGHRHDEPITIEAGKTSRVIKMDL